MSCVLWESCAEDWMGAFDGCEADMPSCEARRGGRSQSKGVSAIGVSGCVEVILSPEEGSARERCGVESISMASGSCEGWENPRCDCEGGWDKSMWRCESI